ncbi:MAG: hypothetical protein WBP42_10220, partial [Candidatus Zixiibacteriota bacterium]
TTNFLPQNQKSSKSQQRNRKSSTPDAVFQQTASQLNLSEWRQVIDSLLYCIDAKTRNLFPESSETLVRCLKEEQGITIEIEKSVQAKVYYISLFVGILDRYDTDSALRTLSYADMVNRDIEYRAFDVAGREPLIDTLHGRFAMKISDLISHSEHDARVLTFAMACYPDLIVCAKKIGEGLEAVLNAHMPPRIWLRT